MNAWIVASCLLWAGVLNFLYRLPSQSSYRLVELVGREEDASKTSAALRRLRIIIYSIERSKHQTQYTRRKLNIIV